MITAASKGAEIRCLTPLFLITEGDHSEPGFAVSVSGKVFAAMAITRREFLIGSGAVLASSTVGCTRSSISNQRHDLCIIGSGFAGTFLGLRAVEHGLRTVIVEAG